MNDYDTLAQAYRKTAEKPDKKYSILPTVMSLLGKLEGKRVLDLGCGSGFFTLPIARRNPEIVYAIDNSQKQLRLLPKHKRIVPFRLDIFRDPLPRADVINAPFILNYAKTSDELYDFIYRTYDSLSPEGKLVAVIDLPTPAKKEIEKKRKKWGAQKRFIHREDDGEEIENELYGNDGESICKLNAFYYRDSTLQFFFENSGFNVSWHKPIISQEGLKRFGSKFWKDYDKYCELGYLIAQKDGTK